MNAPNRCLLLFRQSTMCAIALIATVAGSPAHAKETPEPSVNDQLMVECRLPPQLRSLGSNLTYLAAGRQLRTTVSDCKVRGGVYDGHGPGALAGQGAANAVAAGRRVAVTVGGDKSRAGCPKSGVVTGLTSKGALSVRSGPGTASERIDRLANGKHLFICDWSAGGDWVGVVYPGAAGVDCGVSKSVGRAQPYAGACRSGWVSSKYVKPIAG